MSETPVHPSVSDYMREIQRKSAVARWANVPPSKRAAVMQKVALARWAKRGDTALVKRKKERNNAAALTVSNGVNS